MKGHECSPKKGSGPKAGKRGLGYTALRLVSVLPVDRGSSRLVLVDHLFSRGNANFGDARLKVRAVVVTMVFHAEDPADHAADDAKSEKNSEDGVFHIESFGLLVE